MCREISHGTKAAVKHMWTQHAVTITVEDLEYVLKRGKND